MADGFLQLSAADRRDALEVAGGASGHSLHLLEKDVFYAAQHASRMLVFSESGLRDLNHSRRRARSYESPVAQRLHRVSDFPDEPAGGAPLKRTNALEDIGIIGRRIHGQMVNGRS